jgi:hypothetical protein
MQEAQEKECHKSTEMSKFLLCQKIVIYLFRYPSGIFVLFTF